MIYVGTTRERVEVSGNDLSDLNDFLGKEHIEEVNWNERAKYVFRSEDLDMSAKVVNYLLEKEYKIKEIVLTRFPEAQVTLTKD